MKRLIILAVLFVPVSIPSFATAADFAEEPVTKKGEAAQGLILFVDDESEIRALAQAVLHDAGFSIIEARDGQEAIEKFRDHHTNLRLVILDLMMPNKTGLEAYLEIIDIDPSVPVIFSSGFNESELLNQLPPTARAAFSATSKTPMPPASLAASKPAVVTPP